MGNSCNHEHEEEIEEDNREFNKHDNYGRQETAKVNSDFLLFSCNT